MPPRKRKPDEKFWKTVQEQRGAEISCHFNANKRKCGDVQFLAGADGKLVYGFRFSLASISPVFHSMFYGGMKEGNQDAVISVPDIDAVALNCIIKFSVGVDPPIDEYNCVSVKSATQKYQINSLNSTLDEFILSCVDEGNFCRIYDELWQVPVPDLIQKCLEKMEIFHDFNLMLLSEDFLNLCTDGMKLLVQSEYLRASEETIWERCIEWANHQARIENPTVGNSKKCTKKKNDSALARASLDLVNQVKSGLRFPLMTPEFILQKVLPEKVFSDAQIISLLSTIQCPSPRTKSLLSSELRNSMHPSAYLVYGSGSKVVNGRYDYVGTKLVNGEQRCPAYLRSAPSNHKTTTTLAILFRPLFTTYGTWSITEITNEGWENETFTTFTLPCRHDYFCVRSNAINPPESGWFKMSQGRSPPPQLIPLGPCFVISEDGNENESDG